MTPEASEAHSVLVALGSEGLEHHRAGRLDDAERVYRQILAIEPDSVDALHLLGLVRQAQGDSQSALELIGASLAKNPDFAEAHNNLGNVLRSMKQLERARAEYQRAILLQPDYVDAYLNLGLLEHMSGYDDAALACFQTAARHDPNSGEAQLKLGELFQTLGRLAEAVIAYRRACDLGIENAALFNNLGTVLQGLDRFGDALASYDRAIALDADYAAAFNNRGTVLLSLGRGKAAVASIEKALQLAPEDPRAHTNLGNALQRLGQYAQASVHFRRAVELAPHDAEAHSNLIFNMDFDPAVSTAEQQAERRRWYDAHGRRYAVEISSYDNDATPDRPLRIGYVSADFRQHSAAMAFLPAILHHDRRRFACVCYSDVRNEDSWTKRFRDAAEVWRDTIRIDDDALARAIRADRIDILVDLAGHTGRRLAVFARKPAPVQVSAWGHVTGTGLPTIDYLFADPVLIPTAERPLFAERIFDLPCAIGFETPTEMLTPTIAAAQNEGVTFGCLNRLAKLSAISLDLWASILRAASGSRLLLKTREFDDGDVRQATIDEFIRRGVPAEMLDLRGASSRAAHLATYAEVDVCLDPIPHGGGISTFEALWMGAPVVTLLGGTPAHRLGAAILASLGLGDLIAKSMDDYRNIALTAVKNDKTSAVRRAFVRSQLLGSIAGNPRRYAAAVEAAYNQQWTDWCDEYN